MQEQDGTRGQPRPYNLGAVDGDPVVRAGNQLHKLQSLWQASAYLRPTRPLEVRPQSADHAAGAASGSAHRALLWRSLRHIEHFSETADRLAKTMRHIEQPTRAVIYEHRAEQARYRVALLTSLLRSIELADASIRTYRAGLRLHEATEPAWGPGALASRQRDPAAPRPGDRPREGASQLRLTPREREIATLIAWGYSNRQIADKLVITPGTTANHVAHILSKFGCSSRAQVIASLLTPAAVGQHMQGLRGGA